MTIILIILDFIILGLLICTIYIGSQYVLAINSLEYTLNVFQSDDEEAKERIIENFKNGLATVDIEG